VGEDEVVYRLREGLPLLLVLAEIRHG